MDSDDVDLSGITLASIDDPALVHLTRVSLVFDNATALCSYDKICTACCGDEVVIAGKGKCTECNGSGKLKRKKKRTRFQDDSTRGSKKTKLSRGEV